MGLEKFSESRGEARDRLGASAPTGLKVPTGHESTSGSNGWANWPPNIRDLSARRDGRGDGTARTLIGAKISSYSDGEGYLFDFARSVLIGPSGMPTSLSAVFRYVRELEIRLQHAKTPEAMLDLLRRHAPEREVVDPLYFES